MRTKLGNGKWSEFAPTSTSAAFLRRDGTMVDVDALNGGYPTHLRSVAPGITEPRAVGHQGGSAACTWPGCKHRRSPKVPYCKGHMAAQEPTTSEEETVVAVEQVAEPEPEAVPDVLDVSAPTEPDVWADEIFGPDLVLTDGQAALILRAALPEVVAEYRVKPSMMATPYRAMEAAEAIIRFLSDHDFELTIVAKNYNPE